MSVCESQLSTSGFYHTALDFLMDSMFLSSTPNLETRRPTSCLRKMQSIPGSGEEAFYSVCCLRSLNSDKETKHSIGNAVETESRRFLTLPEDKPKRDIAEFKTTQTESSPSSTSTKVTSQPTTPKCKTPEIHSSSSSSSPGETPKRIIPGARKQKLFCETERFQPRTRSFSSKDLTQYQQLRKAIMRMECLERRQERIAHSKKPARTSLRV